MPSALKLSLTARFSLKFLKILTLEVDSRMAYSLASAPHTNSSALPNILLRHASAV